MTSRGRWLALLLGALAWSFARPAHAIDYEVFVDVEDEDELYELYVTEQIVEATYLVLVDLMRKGTNLDEATREDLYALPNLTYADADRILAYRAEAGHIYDPAVLVTAGVLDQRTLGSIAAFLTVGDVEARKAPVSGFVQYQTIWSSGDRRAPPMVLQARVTTLRHLTIGLAGTLNRNRPGEVRWDPNREALTAEPWRTRPQLTKAFAMWDTPKWGVIGGSYLIGFGQKLTFDNTGRYTPNGFTLDDAYYRRVKLTRLCRESAGELDETPCDTHQYVTPDYRVRYGLLGVAAGAKHIDVGKGWMQAYGFFSYQPRDVYQYQVADRARCEDPGDPEAVCDSPPVYKTRDDPLESTSTLSYQQLPNMATILLGGANVAWFADRRTHVGVTGYGAVPKWLTDGADLDFKRYAILPYGGAFGAAGADMSWGYRWADLFAEVTRSFDNEDRPGGGGFAGIVRSTATWDVHEVEITGRYYDKEFNNPFAHPISSADQRAGLRASDEAGVRVRYNATLAKQVVMRAFLDVWTNVDNPYPKIKTYLHTDWYANDWFRPGLWVDIQDRDTRDVSGPESYCDISDNGIEEDPNGESVPPDQLDPEDGMIDETDPFIGCTGERYTLTGRMRFVPHKRVSLTLSYRHDFTEDSQYPDSVRHDANGFFLISTRPIDPLRLRARVRFYDDDLQNNHRYERSVWVWVDASYRVARWLTPRIRYDIIQRLDERDSTLLRSPVPEHWLWFELESRF